MMERLRIGESYWILRDGTQERFLVTVTGFAETENGNPVALLKVPGHLMVIEDALANTLVPLKHLSVSARYKDQPWGFPFAVNIVRLIDDPSGKKIVEDHEYIEMGRGSLQPA